MASPAQLAPDGAPARASRIFKAILHVGGLTLLTRILVVVRDLTVAARFGTSEELDAYLLAFTVPSVAATIVAVAGALVPRFIYVRERVGQAASARLLANVMALYLLALAVTTAALLAGATTILHAMASHLTPEGLRLSTRLFYCLAPVLVVSCLAGAWGSVLNAEDHFVIPALAPAATAVVSTLGLLVPSSQRVYAFAAGTVVGYCAEALIVGIALRARGLPLVPRWRGMDPDTRAVLGQYAPNVAGSLVLSATTFVNQGLAGMLGPGTISAVNYGSKVSSLVTGIGALSLSTVVLPHFSGMVARRSIGELRALLRSYTRLVFAVSVPLVVGLVIWSRPLVVLVFRRGAFSDQDVEIVSRIQAVSVLQIPVYLAGILQVRVITSFSANQILFVGAWISLFVNVVAGFALAKGFGPVGIGLVAPLVYLVTFVFLALMADRLMRAGMSEAAGQAPSAGVTAP
jgi:putative peptidoglycan lipid II flippase